jgi:hypothetical protein
MGLISGHEWTGMSHLHFPGCNLINNHHLTRVNNSFKPLPGNVFHSKMAENNVRVTFL